MAKDGVLGNGVKVAYSATSPVSWLPIGQILNCDLPGLSPDEVETTVHSTGSFKRFIRGLIDVTEMNLTLLADLDETTSADQDALFDLQAAGTTVYWRVEVPVKRDHTKYTSFEFSAWVKKWLPKAPIAGRQELDCSLRFDGSSFTKNNAGSSVIS